LGIYRVQEITKEEFVVNVVQVEMQRCHMYNTHHATRVVNVAIAYQTKHRIIDNDML